MKFFSVERADDVIIEAIRTGGGKREEAAKYLIDRHIGFIYKVSRKLRLEEALAKDAYLDAVIAVIQQVESGAYRGENKLSSYLYQIFYFKSIDILRKHSTNSEEYMEQLPDRADDRSDMSLTLEQRESVSQIERLLERMGQPCKQILMDWGFWGYQIQEIAERMGVDDPVKISRRKYKCLEELREMMEELKFSQQRWQAPTFTIYDGFSVLN